MPSDAALHTLKLAFARSALSKDEVDAAVERARACGFRLFTLADVLHASDTRPMRFGYARVDSGAAVSPPDTSPPRLIGKSAG